MNEKNPVLALAVTAGILSTAQIYGQYAPSLKELRTRDVGDTTGRQELMDADILVGSIAIVAGSFVSWAVHDIGPLIVLLFTFSVISYWHHMVLNSTNAHTEKHTNERIG